jgi:protein O-GlcNAc transferase
MTLSQNDIGTLIALVNQERLSEAEQRTRSLLGRYPKEGMLWKILSVTLGRQGKDALEAMRKTTELMPQDPEAHANLGAVLHDQRQWEEALLSLRRALQMQPDDLDTLVNSADALRELGRAAEAVPLYQRALQLNPQLVTAQNDLGNAFLFLGQFEEAVGCYQRALKLKPGDALIRFNLANVLRQAARAGVEADQTPQRETEVLVRGAGIGIG